jgi:putative nucleotidyltransferase with HDIG domain
VIFESSWKERQVALTSEFFPISIGSLKENLITGFDLYLPAHEGDTPVLYREKHLPFETDDRVRLSKSSIEELLVKSTDKKAWVSYAAEVLPDYLADASNPVEERAGVLYESATGLVEELLTSPDAADLVSQSRNMAGGMVDFLAKESTSFYELMQLTSHDYYTYTHSVNVFVYSVSLAKKLGRSGPELDEFAHGALMHDIGKRMIDNDIINAPGGLSEAQWQQMQSHPVHGYEILVGQGETSQIALDVTRHHHEKMNGRGYPDGLKGEEIFDWVRISTIADIFDALTTQRSYKDAMDTFVALRFMQDKMSDELDADFFREFVTLMAGR